MTVAFVRPGRRHLKGVHVALLLLAAFAAGGLLPYLNSSSGASAVLGGSPMTSSGDATARAPAPAPLGGSAAFQQYVGDAAALGDCQAPQLDEAVINEYGDCRVLKQACFDQVSAVLLAWAVGVGTGCRGARGPFSCALSPPARPPAGLLAHPTGTCSTSS